jgi:drug/metabolite transporter (DMT)-like permease
MFGHAWWPNRIPQPSLIMSSTRHRAILALIVTMVLWGSAAVFMRTLALSLSPENSLAVRYVLLSLINVAGLLWLGTWRIPRADWPRFLVAGIIGMAGYNWFVNAGFELVPAGVGTLVTMVEPLMIAILAAMLLGEKLTIYVLIGVVMAIAGSVVLFWPDLTATSPKSISLLGIVYLLICCVGWAVYTIVAKPLLDRHDSFTVTAVTMLIAAPIMIGAASEPLPVLAARLDLRQWFEVIYLVLAAGVGGTMLWNYGTKHLSGTSAGTFLYLIPVVAVVAGALVLDEKVTIYILAGGFLMLAGVAAAQFGPQLRGKA